MSHFSNLLAISLSKIRLSEQDFANIKSFFISLHTLRLCLLFLGGLREMIYMSFSLFQFKGNKGGFQGTILMVIDNGY
jgi:hypothetical protein